jgi:hypothetical protein
MLVVLISPSFVNKLFMAGRPSSEMQFPVLLGQLYFITYINSESLLRFSIIM